MAERIFTITTEDRQAALDDAWEQKTPSAITLYAQLRAFEKSARTPTLLSGVVIMSSGSNGHTGQAFSPGAGAPTPMDFARVWRELRNLCERAIVWLGQPVGLDNYVPATYSYRQRDTFALITVNLPVTNPTDEQIDGLMRQWLVPITEAQSDYNALRLGNGVSYLG